MANRHERRRRPCANILLIPLVGLLAWAAAGCGQQAKPVTAETTKFRPADDSAPANGNEPGSSPLFPSASGGADVAADAAPRGNAAESAPGVVASSAKGAASAGDKSGNAKAPVAGGDLQQLLVQMDRLSQQQPKGKTQQEQIEDFVRNQQQRLVIGAKALAMNPEKQVKQRIVQAMYEIHRFFVDQLRAPGAREQLAAFSKSLVADADPDLQRMGRHTQFEANVSRIANEQAGDGKDILAELKKLLDAEQGALHEMTIDLAGQGVEALMQLDMKDDAVAAQELIAAAVAADPKLADQAPRYADRAKLVKADLQSLLEGVLRDQPGAEEKLLTAAGALLADVKLNAEIFRNMQQVAQLLEVTGRLGAAQQVYEHLAAASKTATDANLVRAAISSAESAKKRLTLVGQPLPVEGVTLDGKSFDWTAYQGKVVLLDFWATWCLPCIEELPNIRRNFEQFHAKGFEVVGINVDHDANRLKEFLTLQELPWVTVTSQMVLDGQASEDFSQLPMAAKCGVDAIPFVVLIGRDGNVDSIHVRGPKLQARLTQLLGPPAAAEVPADPTQPAASAAPPAGEPAPRPAARDRGSLELPRGAASTLALLIAQSLFAADPAVEPNAKTVGDDTAINPYRAKPGLTPTQLMAYIEKMLDKPLAIQAREGFAEAIVEACDRVLSADPPAAASELLAAAETRLALLHRQAVGGKKEADEQLRAFVEQLAADSRPSIARAVKFHKLEQRVLTAADLPLDQLPPLLSDVQHYAQSEQLGAKHLRLASSTVAAINRLEDGDEREKHFAAFGALFAKSSDKELAAYGKKLARKPSAKAAELIGAGERKN